MRRIDVRHNKANMWSEIGRSPIIFNMIIDRLLTILPKDIGARIGELTVSVAVFADDMLFFASTPQGLQKLLDRSTDFLGSCGLRVNVSKYMTVSLRNVPNEKRTVVDEETVFLYNNRVLPALRRSEEWRYLDIPFTSEGRSKVKITPSLQESLTKLTKVPLKPQQRLFAVINVVVPSLYHQLELGNTTISTLRKCDGLCVRR